MTEWLPNGIPTPTFLDDGGPTEAEKREALDYIRRFAADDGRRGSPTTVVDLRIDTTGLNDEEVLVLAQMADRIRDLRANDRVGS